jgi:diguanylate cyclase (GGDEF)-like protein
VFSDIIDKKISEQRIFHLAHYDVLTGLPNRASFHDQFEHTLLHAQRHDEQIALLFLDLDHFKLINDASGHTVRDELLKQVAARLKELIRAEHTVARLGGDEFTVLLCEIDSSHDAATVAEKILHEIARPFRLDHTEVVISASIGISAFPSDGSDAATLLKNADTAMYRAKQTGRNNFQFYTLVKVVKRTLNQTGIDPRFSN